MDQSRSISHATLGALGVVYGDIGTSPLYALREATAAAGGASDVNAMLGVLSLIFWSLLIVISLKYVVFILRADNDGEGGVLSLFALVQQRMNGAAVTAKWLLLLAALGTAFFYCDALITPAISVLGAVEGLEMIDPAMQRAIVPVTLVIIVALFALQRRGTERIGRLFGPIMVVWFASIGLLGLRSILHAPGILVALNPAYAFAVLLGHPGVALVILGAVFLVLTGGEALYIDMGHFGRKPVRLAWFLIVWPALLLSYFGQGALLLSAPAAVANPFFALASPAGMPYLVAIATAAAIIASQATISGAFSVTRQAVQLDLLPRVKILQTSADERGQIYVPASNGMMMVAVCGFVLIFGSSSALSGAYGAAVNGTMVITTLLGAVAARIAWKWPAWRVALVFGVFVIVDLAFVLGNATKIPTGGWVPLVLAAAIFGLFVTWRDGRALLRAELQRRAVPMAELPALLKDVTRVPGTAVFLVSHHGFVPTAMLRNLEHNRVRHENIVILHLSIQRAPRQDVLSRAYPEEVLPGVHVVHARFGFMETPDVKAALAGAARRGLRIDEDCTFFLGWHLVRARARSGIAGMKMRLFAYMQRRSAQAAEFFRMPTRRVVVLATEVEI
ncbi:MAG: potassium transporter Kup [Steroidobacteraceae bacterium]